MCLEAEGDECTQFAPAADSLEPGDTITSVDGVAVATVDALVEELADNKPGDVVTLEIEREGQGASTIEVPLIASPDDPERTIIGFVPFDTATVQLPFEIEIDTDRIGGPSAGLAFTLTLIDELSEGNLLGGLDVAVTGEIDIEGNVGAIGGLPQKVSAVKQVGVDYFLVPASQSPESLEQARLVAGDDVEIIEVATLDDALAALERLGGDPILPPDPPLSDCRVRANLPGLRSMRGHLLFAPDPSSPAAVSEATFNTGRAGSTSRRFATSCAWSPPSSLACRSVSASSSASCSTCSSACRAQWRRHHRRRDGNAADRRGSGTHPPDRPRGRQRDQGQE